MLSLLITYSFDYRCLGYKLNSLLLFVRWITRWDNKCLSICNFFRTREDFYQLRQKKYYYRELWNELRVCMLRYSVTIYVCICKHIYTYIVIHVYYTTHTHNARAHIHTHAQEPFLLIIYYYYYYFSLFIIIISYYLLLSLIILSFLFIQLK